MAPRTFARRFRSETGATPHDWLTNQRLLLAPVVAVFQMKRQRRWQVNVMDRRRRVLCLDNLPHDLGKLLLLGQRWRGL